MPEWLRIDTTPPAQIYAHDGARTDCDLSLPTHRVDSITAGDDREQIGRQNNEFSVSITGAGSALVSRLTAQCLYGVRVRWYDGSTLVRDGISDGLSVRGRVVTITAQGDVWSRDLPIRTTADLREFRDTQPVPRRYGRSVPGVLIQLGPSRTRWLWADHASVAVRSVTVSGAQLGGWSWRNTTDATGRPITIVETVDPVEDGAELVAVGDGAIDTASGELIENPADVVYDLAVLAGLSIDRGTLARYRRDCAARNLVLSGSVGGGTLQAAVESIAASTYAILARTHPDLLILQPDASAAVASLSAADVTGVAGSSDEVATRLLVRFGIEESGPRQSLEVRAPAVELLQGIRSREVTLDWVRDPRVAADVAERMLQDLARPAYVVSYSAQRKRKWLPGERATVSAPDAGLSGVGVVTQKSGDAPTVRMMLGNAPAVSLEVVSAAYQPDQWSGSTVARDGDVFRTRIMYQQRAIVGARCTLDGSTVRYSDGAGYVSWPAHLMQPGVHTIDVHQDGHPDLSLRVAV